MNSGFLFLQEARRLGLGILFPALLESRGVSLGVALPCLFFHYSFLEQKASVTFLADPDHACLLPGARLIPETDSATLCGVLWIGRDFSECFLGEVASSIDQVL
jgi:hypothetical protein